MVGRDVMSSRCGRMDAMLTRTTHSVDDRSTRYVAQENIVPLRPDEFSAEDAEKTFPAEIGKWFRRYDGQTARFVSNVRDEYPED